MNNRRLVMPLGRSITSCSVKVYSGVVQCWVCADAYSIATLWLARQSRSTDVLTTDEHFDDKLN